MSEHVKWIGTRTVAARLDVDVKTVPKIAEAAGIRRRQLPGHCVQYAEADVERVAREAILCPRERRGRGGGLTP